MEDNAKNTLATIKRYINAQRGKISKQMKAALIVQAAHCYEVMEVANPEACGASFVIGTISNAQRR